MRGPTPPQVLAALAAATVACAVQAGACGLLSTDPARPCGGLAQGDRLAITIDERKTPSPQEPGNTVCNDVLGDLPVGMVLEATLTSFEPGSSGNDGCLSGRATVMRSDDWGWQVPANPPRPGGGYAIETQFDANRGSCRGTVDIRLTLPRPPSAGQSIATTFSRVFRRAAGDDRCPESCVGHFGVTVSKR